MIYLCKVKEVKEENEKEKKLKVECKNHFAGGKTMRYVIFVCRSLFYRVLIKSENFMPIEMLNNSE